MAVAVVGQVFVRRNDFTRGHRDAVGFLGVVAQPDFRVGHAVGFEFGGEEGGVGFRFEWDVGGGFVQPLFPQRGVEFAVAQVVGEAKEEPARGGSVEQFPQATRQLAVRQLSWRDWRISVARQDFARRSLFAVFRWIEDGWFIVGHNAIIPAVWRGGKDEFASRVHITLCKV